jgi:hypothetical protein
MSPTPVTVMLGGNMTTRTWQRSLLSLLLAIVFLGGSTPSTALAGDAPTSTAVAGMDGHPLASFPPDPAFMHYAAATRDGSAIYPDYKDASAAYRWLNILQEVTARDVDKVGARPTIISRQMAIPLTAMYDAWAAYDAKAVGTRLGGQLRRSLAERTQTNKEAAIAYAMHSTLQYVFPDDKDYIDGELRRMGYDPADASRDPATPAGVGHLAADAVIEYRRNDGANQAGDVAGSSGKPYSDYTGYVCKNTAEECLDPAHWSPKAFTKPTGEVFAPGGLTPQWGKVKTFALDSGDQFRPGPPPGLNDHRLKAEVDECIRYNASLTSMQKATVEFMRDGPRSTGQSGHWLRFAQDLSRRDHYTLDQDVKLFFSVSNICLDTFIACWEAKYVYDSPRPQALVNYFYKDQLVPGWLGYGKGVGQVKGQDWQNYSPYYFVCPPFPAYPSGHSTVSAGASTILKLFSGSDWFGFYAPRVPGSITHEPMDEVVMLELPSFTATAEMAGISRVMGGYHTQADNIAALELGRKIANFEWPRYQAYFDGTAEVRP